jgi:diguanylate cyclase (GGDEF)-like protein
MPDCGVEQGFEVAERIRRAVSGTAIITTDGVVQASLSVGVAEVAGARNLSASLARADTALYRAKNAGRGCTRAVA